MSVVAAKSPWNPIDNPIDKAKVGGMYTPGLCEVVGASSPRDWAEFRGYGLSGATVRFRGIKLSHFSLRIRLYSVEDWNDWHAFKPIVDKPPLGKRPRAIDISHPLLEDLGIRSAVVEDVGQPDEDDDGAWTIEVKLIEFRKPKLTLSTPEGSDAGPVDPVDAQIEARRKHIADQRDELAGP